MPSTTPLEDVKSEIKDIWATIDGIKANCGNQVLSDTRTIVALQSQVQNINATTDSISKDQKDILKLLYTIHPAIITLTDIEIPELKKQQAEITKFRWKFSVVYGIGILILSAIITASVGALIKRQWEDKFVDREEISDIYKFTESLRIKEANAQAGKQK